MNQTNDPLLGTPKAEQSKVNQIHKNWYICGALLLIIGGLDIWLLSNFGLVAWASTAKLESIYFLLFHAFVAVLATIVLLAHYIDTVPMMARYRVPGSTSIPMVEHAFVHSGRWTTFTTWCNTLAASYFWLVTLASVLMLQDDEHDSLPTFLAVSLGILWDISFPMGFLVNLIVTFVLIPAKKKNGDFQGLWYMLKWRGQALHNGYVICVALEAVLVAPTMPLKSFPVIVLYGITYYIFSFILFAKTGVFHYFFLDPRWKFAPLGLFGLLGLLAGLFCAGSFALQAGEDAWLARFVVVAAALGTCTFRDPAAVAPTTLSGSTVG